jgi:hypothetical protein
VNLTRFHGVFAPNSGLRALVTPGRSARYSHGDAGKTASERHAAMTWARRLKRVFRIDIETCRHCGGSVKVIVSIEDPVVIKRILEHLDRRAGKPPLAFGPLARAPPQGELPGLRNKVYGFPLPHARTPCLAGYWHGSSRAHPPPGSLFANQNTPHGADS